jgi:hypothetical protein
VAISLSNGKTYVPGVKQQITVTVADPAQRRWAFELTARLNSNLSTGQAGTLTNADANAQIIGDNGRRAPCTTAAIVQFATHTLAGTRAGTANSITFLVDWTPPATNVGNITLYAAGNAADGTNTEGGDHIYTTSLELTPAVLSTAPAITSGGVVNAASYQPAVSASSYVTIIGTNLSTTTRSWTGAELAAARCPRRSTASA